MDCRRCRYTMTVMSLHPLEGEVLILVLDAFYCSKYLHEFASQIRQLSPTAETSFSERSNSSSIIHRP